MTLDDSHGCGLFDMPWEPWTRVVECDLRWWQVFERVRTQGFVNGDVVYVLEEGQTEQDRCPSSARDTSLACSCNGGWSGEKRVRVLSRLRDKSFSRVLARKASMAEQWSWDIRRISGNAAAEPTSLEEEVNFPVIDDSDSLVSEPRGPENEDPDDEEMPTAKLDEDIPSEGSEAINFDRV